MVNFANKEERDYYVFQDPVHLNFVKWSDDAGHKVLALDYGDGVFGDHSL
jgi:hypothetical protein